MRGADFTSQFRRDLKKVELRGYDMPKLKEIITKLLENQQLPLECRDHQLKGQWRHCRELHIESDWLLVYRIDKDICLFYRTGTHSDIFGE